MQYHDVFFSRLRLLIIMARAFLKNYPVGEHRLRAVIRNAETVARDCVDWNGYHDNFRSSPESRQLLENDHIFYQRVKLLAQSGDRLTITIDGGIREPRLVTTNTFLALLDERLELSQR